MNELSPFEREMANHLGAFVNGSEHPGADRNEVMAARILLEHFERHGLAATVLSRVRGVEGTAVGKRTMTKLERKIITAIGNILCNEAEECDPGEVYFARLIVDAWEREGFQSAMEKAQDGIDRINERKDT